jgi:hypothetical protein
VVTISACSSIRLWAVPCEIAVSLTPERASARIGSFSDLMPAADLTAASRAVSTGALPSFCAWPARTCAYSATNSFTLLIIVGSS